MRRLLAAATLLVLTCGAPTAFAEPFRVTAVLTFGEGGPATFSLIGPELAQGVPQIDTQGVFTGLFQVPLLLCYPCQAGTQVSANLDFTGANLGSGTVSIEGGPRQQVFYGDGRLDLFGDPFIVPELTADGLGRVTTSIAGELELEGWVDAAHTSKIFAGHFVLEGLATATFARRDDDIYWAGLVYEMRNQVPVPEPASLVLLTSGAAGLIAWRRRRRP